MRTDIKKIINNTFFTTIPDYHWFLIYRYHPTFFKKLKANSKRLQTPDTTQMHALTSHNTEKKGCVLILTMQACTEKDLKFQNNENSCRT